MNKILEANNSDRHEYVYTALYGSQNYKLDNTNSDKDYKMLVVPHTKALILNNKQLSKVVEVEDGLVEIKDIRKVFDSYKKMSIVDIETLFSVESIVNNRYGEEMLELIKMREDIVASNPFRLYQVVLGVMTSLSSRKNFTDKDACQVIRYYDIFDRYLIGKESFEETLDTLKSERYQFMLDTKDGKVSKEELMKEIYFYIDITRAYKNKIDKERNHEVYERLDDILLRIFEKRIKVDLDR